MENIENLEIPVKQIIVNQIMLNVKLNRLLEGKNSTSKISPFELKKSIDEMLKTYLDTDNYASLNDFFKTMHL